MKPVQYIHAAGAFLLSAAILLPGCSSEDSGSVSASVSPPPNAIVFDDTNAAATAEIAIGIVDALQSFKGTSATAPVNDIIRQAVQMARARNQNTGVDLFSGPAFNDSYSCLNSSPVTAGSANSATESGNYTINTDGSENGTGTITFYTCEFSGIVISGSFSFSYTESASGSYTDNSSGSLTMVIGSQSISITSMTLNENGDNSTGVYTISKLQYVYNPGTGGFSIETTAAIQGNIFDCGPTAGQLLLKGGSSSKAQVTFNSNMAISVELDTGSGFAHVPGSPFTCL